MMTTRRRLLATTAAACLLGISFRRAPAQQPATRLASHVAINDRAFHRAFSGPAFPPVSVRDPRSGAVVAYHAAFPNDHDPFAIDTSLRLGDGGFGLQVEDRGLAGILPGEGEDWLLNMIPFGVAIDGSILDPSGPWYDGGPADPDNPFDRACTGWEYEVNHPDVGALVGVPDDIKGHVQPGGLFHYHGYPAPMIAAARMDAANPDEIMLVGYSADGFPVIDHRLISSDGRHILLVSGYVLRTGRRQALPRTNPGYVPPGDFDGLYVQDYIYDPDAKHAMLDRMRESSEGWFGQAVPARPDISVLDERNGLVLGSRLNSLPDYPNPHYAYALTPDWPQIPRLFAQEPHETFRAIIPFDVTGIGPRIAALLGADVPEGRRILYENCGERMSDMRGLLPGRLPY